jgi:hypothetical protein
MTTCLLTHQFQKEIFGPRRSSSVGTFLPASYSRSWICALNFLRLRLESTQLHIGGSFPRRIAYWSERGANHPFPPGDEGRSTRSFTATLPTLVVMSSRPSGLGVITRRQMPPTVILPACCRLPGGVDKCSALARRACNTGSSQWHIAW